MSPCFRIQQALRPIQRQKKSRVPACKQTLETPSYLDALRPRSSIQSFRMKAVSAQAPQLLLTMAHIQPMEAFCPTPEVPDA
jgi:hypothetical protein